jgi:uncharacterized membrane-anchored protein
MKTKLLLLTLVLTLQTAWILGTSIVHERVLGARTLIMLETWPVDPRDLVSGDYVTLNYAISSVPKSLFSATETNRLTPGQTVYVALKSSGEFWTIAKASLEMIPAADSQVILQGEVTSGWASRPNAVRVSYGLERYYVREGTGNPRGKLTVQVAVPSSGAGQIKQVFLDGEPYAKAMKAHAN